MNIKNLDITLKGINENGEEQEYRISDLQVRRQFYIFIQKTIPQAVHKKLVILKKTKTDGVLMHRL